MNNKSTQVYTKSELKALAKRQEHCDRALRFYVNKIQKQQDEQGDKMEELSMAYDAIQARLDLAFETATNAPKDPKEHLLGKRARLASEKTLAQRAREFEEKNKSKVRDWETMEEHIPEDNGEDSDGNEWFISAD